MADKPTSGPANDPDIKGMIEESLNTPAERGELIDIINSSKAVKSTFQLLSDHMDNPVVRRALESDVVLFDFIANCKDAGVAEAFADDYISQQKAGLTMPFENFPTYKFNVYVKAFGGEKQFKALLKKLKSDKIEISPKAPVRDDEETKKVDYRKDDMPKSGKILTIDSYNPDGDYNSEEEVPLFPNLIGVDSEKYRNMSLDELKKEIEVRKKFRDEQVEKSKRDKSQQVSEIFLIGFEWLNRYYAARVRVNEKLKKTVPEKRRHEEAERIVKETMRKHAEEQKKREEEERKKREEEVKAEEAEKEEARKARVEAARKRLEEAVTARKEEEARKRAETSRREIDEAIRRRTEQEKQEREERARKQQEEDEKAKEAVSPKAEALIRAITVEQWQDLLHMAEAMGEKKEWIDETFKFSGDGKIVRSGDLDLRNNPNLTRLPENLEIGGNLFIPCHIGLASLLKGPKVGGHIYVADDKNEDAKKEAEEKNKTSASAKATADETAKEASESNEKPAGYRFEIREGGKVIGEITLDQKVIEIGREKNAHLSIDNANVSRLHARIEAENQSEIFIMDLDSTKGTFLNGQKIENTVKTPLKSGDVIGLGEDNIEITFSVVQETATGTDADDETEVDDDAIESVDEVEAPTPYPKNPTEKIMRLYSDFASQQGTHIELNKLTETFKLIVLPDSKVTVGIVTPGATIEVMDGGQVEVLYSIGDFTDKPLTIVLSDKREEEGQVQPVILGEFADINSVIKRKNFY